MKLIAPESVDPGSEVSIQQQRFKVGRDRVVDVPEPLAKHLMDIGFKQDFSKIQIIGSKETTSLGETLQERGKLTQTTSTEPSPAVPPGTPTSRPITAEMTEEEKQAQIRKDAEDALAAIAGDLGGQNTNLTLAGQDAQKTLENAPGEKDQANLQAPAPTNRQEIKSNNPAGVVDSLKAEQFDNPGDKNTK
jgi:hypothetical protein